MGERVSDPKAMLLIGQVADADTENQTNDSSSGSNNNLQLQLLLLPLRLLTCICKGLSQLLLQDLQLRAWRGA